MRFESSPNDLQCVDSTLPWVAAGLLAACSIAYANSVCGAFVYDDQWVLDPNYGLGRLWDPARWSSPRGLVDFSFAVNFALGNANPVGYHLVNLAIHACAGLALFGLVRRTLSSPCLVQQFAGVATPFALSTALLWMVHPLTTQGVTYVCQRYESTAAMFCLLGLYSFCRAAQSGGSRSWWAAVLLCFALGLRCKETALVFPLLVAAYDRALVAGNWPGSVDRKYLYLGLLLTAGALGSPTIFRTAAGLVEQVRGIEALANVPQGIAGPTTIHVEGVTPWTYLRTQPAVILHYLRLCMWPQDLCIDYAWPVAQQPAEIVPSAIALLTLLAMTGYGVSRFPRFTFPAVAFFVWLAPTSSIVPIADRAVEHRMYLPLAAVVTLAVLGAHALAKRISGRELRPRTIYVTASIAAIPLAVLTISRNSDYFSPVALWRETLRVSPNNPRALDNLAVAYLQVGRHAEALTVMRRAAEISPRKLSYELGVLLERLGHNDEAVMAYRRAVELLPHNQFAYNNLGRLLDAAAQPEEAVANYRRAVELDPNWVMPRHNLAALLARTGDSTGAVDEYERAIQIDSGDPGSQAQLALLLVKVGRSEEAIEHFRAAARLAPEFPELHFQLGQLLAGREQYQEASVALERALALNPRDTRARLLLKKTLTYVRVDPSLR